MSHKETLGLAGIKLLICLYESVLILHPTSTRISHFLYLF